MSEHALSFGAPYYLFLVIPIAILFYWWHIRAKHDQDIRRRLLPGSLSIENWTEMPHFRTSSITLLATSCIFLGLALIQPRFGFESIETKHLGADIILAVDVSESMLAEDTPPDRLTLARRKISDLTQTISGDRLSLVSFAGASFIETPLTLDYQIISLTAESLATDLVPLKGSDLEAAVHAAITVFGENTEKSNRAKILLLISDMEFDPETQAQAFELMKKEKIIPFGIAIGTPEGAPLSGPRGFRKDKTGKIIYSRSVIEPLDQAFQQAGGVITRHTAGEQDLSLIYKNGIKKLTEQGELIQGESRIYNEYFQFPLFLGLLLCIAVFFGINLTSQKSNLILLTGLIAGLSSFCSYPLVSFADEPLSQDSVSDLYNSGKYIEALSQIDKMIERGEDSYDIRLKRGNTLYRLNRFSDAAEDFAKAYNQATSSEKKAHALFNRGNALTQSGQLKDALAHYEEAQKEFPEDTEAAKNLAYIKKLLNEDTKENQKDQNSKNNQESKPEENQESDEHTNQSNPSEKQDQESQSNSPKPEQSESQGTSSDDQMNEREEEQSKSNDDSGQDSGHDSGQQDQKPEETESDTELNKEEEDDGRKEKEAAAAPSPAESGQSQEGEAEMTYDQIESQLDSLEESTSLRAKHRYQKAMEQLEKLPRKSSDMDW